jgi:simple sugar transport system permease protein
VSDDKPRWKRTLDRLVDASAKERLVISVAALVLAVAVGFVIVVLAGLAASCAQTISYVGVATPLCYDPFAVYSELFLGAIGHPERGGWTPLDYRMAVTLQQTTLLTFTGLAVAISFRAGLFNIGVQGQMVFGALGAALATIQVGSFVPGGLLGTLVLVPLGILAGALAGGLWGALPGALKAYADANEVITTIMLNFVAVNIAYVVVATWFTPADSSLVQTANVPTAALIPNVPFAFRPRDNFSLLGLLFAVALVAGLAYLLARTSFGYDLRTTGKQPEAAAYGGVDEKRTTVASLGLSGALGGVAGAVLVMMVQGRWLADIPQLGFDGITVSILAGNNPLGVGFAALLFGVLKSGSLAIGFGTDVPPQLVDVLRGLVVLFVAMPEFFRMVGERYGYGGGVDA